jgi:cyclophilin family peptidyl-prolyl cis-trans isomerase
MKRSLAVLAMSSLLMVSACAEDRSATDKATADKGGGDGKKPVVVVTTSMGKIKIELYPDKAPITVKNFLKYVDDKFYDNTVFHRVMEDFMIQGGGFKTGIDKVQTPRQFQALEKEARDPIKNEAKNGLSNTRGTIAMARTPEPDSATAQFFINVKNNSDGLDPNPDRDPAGYCVFGKVIDGMDVVDKIRKVRTHVLVPRQIEGVPDEDVVIKSVRRAED